MNITCPTSDATKPAVKVGRVPQLGVVEILIVATRAGLLVTAAPPSKACHKPRAMPGARDFRQSLEITKHLLFAKETFVK